MNALLQLVSERMRRMRRVVRWRCVETGRSEL